MSEKAILSFRFEGQDIKVRGWPDRPFNVKKVYTDGRYSKFAVNEKGEFFCSLVTKGRMFYPRVNSKVLCILNGLAMIGHPHLNRKMITAIRAQEERSKEFRDKGYAAEQFLQYALQSGIDLLPTQLRKAQGMVKLGKKHDED